MLNDPDITSKAATFVSHVVNTETARTGLGALLVQALAMQSVQDQALVLSQGVVASILEDEAMIDKTAVFVCQVLQREDTIAQTVKLVEDVLASETTQTNTQNLLLTILASDPTRKHAVELETWALEEMLKDEWVIQHVKDFLRTILNDTFVQQDAGNAVWGAVKYSVLPSIFQSAPPPDGTSTDTGASPSPPNTILSDPVVAANLEALI